MPGRQAKILSKDNADDLLVFASTTRHPLRNRLIVLLSVKAGLRAAEIAHLTWEMVLTPTAEIGPTIELHDRAALDAAGAAAPEPGDHPGRAERRGAGCDCGGSGGLRRVYPSRIRSAAGVYGAGLGKECAQFIFGRLVGKIPYIELYFHFFSFS